MYVWSYNNERICVIMLWCKLGRNMEFKFRYNKFCIFVRSVDVRYVLEENGNMDFKLMRKVMLVLVICSKFNFLFRVLVGV